MRNCLATYATDAAAGRVFFYSYDQARLPHAVIGLEPGDDDDGWAVWAIAAYANRAVPRELHDTIVAAIAEVLGRELRDPCCFNAAMRRVASVGRTSFPEAERQRLFAEMVEGAPGRGRSQ
jgi:hypothetical protein